MTTTERNSYVIMAAVVVAVAWILTRKNAAASQNVQNVSYPSERIYGGAYPPAAPATQNAVAPADGVTAAPAFPAGYNSGFMFPFFGGDPEVAKEVKKGTEKALGVVPNEKKQLPGGVLTSPAELERQKKKAGCSGGCGGGCGGCDSTFMPCDSEMRYPDGRVPFSKKGAGVTSVSDSWDVYVPMPVFNPKADMERILSENWRGSSELERMMNYMTADNDSIMSSMSRMVESGLWSAEQGNQWASNAIIQNSAIMGQYLATTVPQLSPLAEFMTNPYIQPGDVLKYGNQYIPVPSAWDILRPPLSAAEQAARQNQAALGWTPVQSTWYIH